MRLTIHAKPGARKSELEVMQDGSLRVWIHGQPADGEANKELIRFLSEILDIRKSAVTIISGANGRFKIVEVEIEEGLLAQKLAPFKATS